MGVDRGPLEAEVIVILNDFFINGGVMYGDVGERNFGSIGGAMRVEEAAVDVFEGGRRDDVFGGGDELNADFFESDGSVAVVGDDDANGKKAVLNVGQAEEWAVMRVGTGFGRDGDVLVGMGVERSVLIGWFGRRGLFVVSEGWNRYSGQGGGAEKRFREGCEGPVGVHEQVQYHLRWRCG